MADHTRWMRKPRSYGGLQDGLAKSTQTYRRVPWWDRPAVVEVRPEKDARAGVRSAEAAGWDVPPTVTRGDPSLSYLAEKAEAFAAAGRLVRLSSFGDRALGELAPGAKLRFERVAVTAEQIAAWNPPTQPTKAGDGRGRGCAERHLDLGALARTRAAERLERETLVEIARGWAG